MRNTNAKCCWPPIIELEMIFVLHPISIDKKKRKKKQVQKFRRRNASVSGRVAPQTNNFREFQRNQRFGECEKILTATTVYRHFYPHTHPTFIIEKTNNRKRSSSLNYRHSTAHNKNSIAAFISLYFIIIS